MSLKSTYEKRDDIPEAHRDLFVERGGKWEIQVEGMKTQGDVDRLQTALASERNDHKLVKDELTSWRGISGGKKPDELRTILDKVPELEAIASGTKTPEDLEKLVEARATARVAPLQRELDETKKQLGEKDSLIGEFKIKDKTRTIHDAVRDGITKAGAVKTAIADALLLAERVFDVDEKGNVVVKDGTGFTPGIAPDLWAKDVAVSRPHWFGTTGGGGAGGGSIKSGVDNPFSDEGWNLTKQGQMVKENADKANRYAKAAGTTVGGPRPRKAA